MPPNPPPKLPSKPKAQRNNRLDCERMFLAVLDRGSFAAAAAQLGTSAGQASKLVARLEAELGVQLLKRSTRALAPTELGLAYHRRLAALIEEFDTLEDGLRDAGARPAGRLRLSAPMSFGMSHLVPALLDFARVYPEIALDVSFSDRVVDLIEEGFDLALRIGAPADTALIGRRLCDVAILTVAAPSYLAARGRPLHPRDLAGHDCIIDSNFRDGQHWHLHDPETGQVLAVPVAGRLRFSDGLACLRAAEAGLGIARLPGFLLAEALRAGRVERLLPAADQGPAMAVSLLYPPARHLARKLRVLVDFLAARFREGGDWPAP